MVCVVEYLNNLKRSIIYASWFDQQYKLTWKDAIATKKHITIQCFQDTF